MNIFKKRKFAERLLFALQPMYAPTQVARGINKQTTYKKQTGLGVLASGAGGQILRRRTSVFKLARDTFESDEIVSHQQSTGSQFGMQQSTGKIEGLLSPGTYKDFMSTGLRAAFITGVNTGALVNVASNAGAPGNFTRAAGSFLTDGFKVWDIVRWTGWTTTAVTDNSRNFLITSLTATVMTGFFLDGTAIPTKVAGDSVTGTVVGKKCVAASSAQTNDFFTFEEWYSDIAKSEQFPDCKLDQMAFNCPGSGNVGVTLDFKGLKRNLNAAQQFTTPTVETSTQIETASNGAVIVNGTQYFVLTGCQFTMSESADVDGPVIGSDTGPDISVGRIRVSGQFTGYYADQVLMTLFQNEVGGSPFYLCITTDQTATSDFVAFRMTRVKVHSDDPDDGEKGISRTYQFTAEIDLNGGAGLADDKAIMVIQDSQA